MAEQRAKDDRDGDASSHSSEGLTATDAHNQPTELVFAVVGALGTDHAKIRRIIVERLKAYLYQCHEIRISEDVIAALVKVPARPKYDRAKALIDQGNSLREKTGANHFLATAAVAVIKQRRTSGNGNRTTRQAFVISSLKHPEEVAELRRIYGPGFFLFAVHRSRTKRLEHLIHGGEGMPPELAEELIARDEHEEEAYGQHLRDTFHLADFFVSDEGIEEKLKNSIERCIDLVFGMPVITPTFNEYAMFMAFGAALRSADLSRQVGAVVARDRQIISSGANDCPVFGGGLYWPEFTDEYRIEDIPGGRDYIRKYDRDGRRPHGFDSNAVEKAEIITQVLMDLGLESTGERVESLRAGPIGDITEYGRVVHAEMEALLACARAGISCQDATLFSTTFPCHNCAKHIIAAGIKEVVFVEPYPKSKALQFHQDSAVLEEKVKEKVRFKPFVGVGPRRFFELFSMVSGTGQICARKGRDGRVIDWRPGDALPRMKLLPVPYQDFEDVASDLVIDFKEGMGKENYNDEAKGVASANDSRSETSK